ncbi:hypothetical protein CFELI_03830 [Corynebacterium felinum]|uniref:Uncharacterized protein n=1 Tax=Corynebacterium felinum TaxID=131318 RepID=A0ABU2B8V6_9CORY|nr:hypothetical protein [Corynebacterium felinum]WJY94399.1 hypothetical protein CFELI_03830 [Corynebacterium felinum]
MNWSSFPVRQVLLRGVHGLWELRKLDFSLPKEHESVGSHKKGRETSSTTVVSA